MAEGGREKEGGEGEVKVDQNEVWLLGGGKGRGRERGRRKGGGGRRNRR